MPKREQSSILPLNGIRVVEMCDIWVGPGVGTMLGDMGAEVVKVESIQRRTISRGSKEVESPNPHYPNSDPGVKPWNRNCHFNHHNHNKRSITIDLRRQKGVSLFKTLIKSSDVLIENFYSAMLPKLGLDYEILRKVRPDLIMLSMPPYGSTGPYKDHVTYGFLIDAVCGHASLRGYQDTHLANTGAAFLQDPAGISMGVYAVIGALVHRLRTGQGQHVEMAQMEAFIPRIGEITLDYAMNGTPARRVGNRHPSIAPHGAYPSLGNDHWVTLSVASENEWEGLCSVIQRPDLLKKFPNPVLRWRHQDEIDDIIAKWTCLKTDYEAMHTLQEFGVPAGVAMDASQLYKDPHLVERKLFEHVSHKEAGKHTYQGAPWKMSRSKTSIKRPAPLLGEDNHYVYRQILGLAHSDLAELERDKYIGTEPMDPV